MNPNKDFFKIYWGAIKLAIGIVLGLILVNFFCTSCTMSKKTFGSKKDSTVISRIDSGTLKKTETSTNSDWWREILNFQPHKDSVYIEKTAQPIYIDRPVQIIREGGTMKTTQVNTDSVWNNRMDSLIIKLSENSKNSKTKVFDFWQILALGVLGFLVLGVVLRGRKII